MPIPSATRETAQPGEAAETVAPSQMGQDIPAAREEMLSTSGMSAGASEDASTQEGSRRLQGREPHYSGSRVPPEGSRDPRPSREPRPPWTASPRQSEGEATRRRSGNGRPQQRQRAAGEQQAAAGRCEREQMGRVVNAAHEKQPADSYELQRDCTQIARGGHCSQPVFTAPPSPLSARPVTSF
jgi:hypothetical protein